MERLSIQKVSNRVSLNPAKKSEDMQLKSALSHGMSALELWKIMGSQDESTLSGERSILNLKQGRPDTSNSYDDYQDSAPIPIGFTKEMRIIESEKGESGDEQENTG
eukprot:CAMPEP_0170541962 /NCGR_PEP_ID=MMETSP0211-20121228/1543_1 /TAXON_ID=311385 /ORGANISM="Pseudokeronopsis sp., Strain OXSARD2" /LENGTH=106 /DNA_ID=CAMNT_0010844877 /DNA_START=1328 /DNA_END=1648 /DNA_ORIENTATION=-